MQRKMERDRIPGFVGSTADQWVAIQTYALSVPPVVQYRAPLWQTNTRRGQQYTQCLNCLLRDIARKHNHNLEKLLRIPVAGPVRPIGPAGPAGCAAPVAAVNDRKLSQNIGTE